MSTIQKKKIEKTPEEIAAAKLLKETNQAIQSLTVKVKNRCKDGGLRSVQAQLEFLIAHNTQLPERLLGKSETIQCFEEGIKNYLTPPQPKEIRKRAV